MQLHILKTKEDHATALKDLDAVMTKSPRPGSEEFEQMEVLALLVEAYEKIHFLIEATDALSAITFRMEQQGLKQIDLVPFIGSRARVSEVLAGKRRLSLAMIRALHDGLDIPLESLVSQPAQRGGRARPRAGASASR